MGPCRGSAQPPLQLAEAGEGTGCAGGAAPRLAAPLQCLKPPGLEDFNLQPR